MSSPAIFAFVSFRVLRGYHLLLLREHHFPRTCP
jgi:hypothetical protein